MGNHSWLLATLNNPEDCISDEVLSMTPYYETDYPKNLEEVAKIWSGTKLCGYFSQDYIDKIRDLCSRLKPYGKNPRLFYEVEGYYQVWCLEFVPGTRTVNIAIYDFYKDIVCGDDDDDDETVYWEKHGKVISEISGTHIHNEKLWNFTELI